MNEELDSQLSAMFDDELPPAECELLARRLSRDEQLKARWGRYAVMGAAIRAERGVRLNAQLASRVSAVLVAEPALAAQSAGRVHVSGLRWWQPVAGAAVAASVAAVSILWLRSQGSDNAATLSARLTGTPAAVAARVLPNVAATSGQGVISYTVPRTPKTAAMVVPTTELANYVVAHSMFSMPVARSNLLSAFMSSEPAAAGGEEPQDDAKNPVQ
jgi:negative regulator of sigma E activity